MLDPRHLCGRVHSKRTGFDIMVSVMQHHAVRVTLTLDDDVAAKLRSEAR
jgi:hypothetical protein